VSVHHTCPGCTARLPDWPSTWLADGNEFCSADCAQKADNKVHTNTRNVPADRWLADQDARDEARRIEAQRARIPTETWTRGVA
jgi:hypothetical protein